MGLFDFLFSDPKLVAEAKIRAKSLFKEYEIFKGKVGQNSVKGFLEKPIFEVLNNKSKHDQFEKLLKNEGITPEIWVLSSISSVAANAVSTGHNHLHRGTLNPMTGADTLLPIFIDSQKKLVSLGHITQELADESIKIIKGNIASCG